jgi:predicted amidohydrolase
MGSAPVTIAAVQMCSTDDLAANLATCKRLAAQAAAGGAKIIVLPVLRVPGQPRERQDVAETIDDAHPADRPRRASDRLAARS